MCIYQCASLFTHLKLLILQQAQYQRSHVTDGLGIAEEGEKIVENHDLQVGENGVTCVP